MSRDYLDFDVAITREGQGYAARAESVTAGRASVPFALPFAPADLARFMVAVGPPRVSSRRLVPAEARVVDVKDYGGRLGSALLAGDVGRVFRESLASARAQGRDLRVRLRLDAVPELDPVPWEYLYDRELDRFLTLSTQTPVVRVLDSVERPPVVVVEPPLRVLVMISSPSDMPELAVEREEQLLRGTTGDLVSAGQLELVVLENATLTALQRALLDDFNVFHFIGHGGFDEAAQEGVLVLERDDGTSHRVSGARLGTLLHDAHDMQLAVLNACEGARTSGRDAFSGVGQALVRQGLPAVVAMQSEISDRAAVVFSHEFYWFLTRGLGIDAAMCEVRKAMATSDEAAEWGTAVLLRSGTDQPFSFPQAGAAAPVEREARWDSLYEAAQGAIAAEAPATALPMLEQLAAEKPDYADVTQLIEQVRPAAGEAEAEVEAEAEGESEAAATVPIPLPTPAPVPDLASTQRLAVVTPLVSDVVNETGRATVADWDNARPPSGSRSGIRPAVAALAVLVLLLGAGAWWWGHGLGAMLRCGMAQTTTSEPAASFAFGCAANPPTIDGDFADWEGVGVAVPVTARVHGAAPSSPLRAVWQGQWTSEALYLHARVTDASLRQVEPSSPSGWWRGDGISFEFGPDNRQLSPTTTARGGRDVHILIGLRPNGAEAAVKPGRRRHVHRG